MTRRSASKTSSRLDATLLLFVLAITMSASATSGESAAPRDVLLLVTDAGQYVLAGKPVALADLRGKLRELKSGGSQINLHIRGGSKAEYKFIMPAVQIAQEEGLSKVGYLTVTPAAPDSSASPK